MNFNRGIVVHFGILRFNVAATKHTFDWYKNGIFLGEMHQHMSHEEEQKTFFAAARLFWPEGCLRDFFGLKKAEGLLKAKKS